MATEKEARKARDEYAGHLSSLGVHTIAVDLVPGGSFGVVAFTDGDTSQIPESLEIELGGKKKTVPVKIEKSGPMKLE